MIQEFIYIWKDDIKVRLVKWKADKTLVKRWDVVHSTQSEWIMSSMGFHLTWQVVNDKIEKSIKSIKSSIDAIKERYENEEKKAKAEYERRIAAMHAWRDKTLSMLESNLSKEKETLKLVKDVCGVTEEKKVEKKKKSK